VGVLEHHGMELVDDAGKATHTHKQGCKFVIRLQAGKAKLSRLRSIPRSETFGDSESTVFSMEAENCSGSNFANRVGKKLENMKSWK
jgi:hypothetical protein